MKKKYSKTFKGRLKERRDELGFTQRELSERANISESSIKKYELGQRKPSDFKSLAQALNVSVDWLLCKSDDMSYDEKQALINRILYDKKEEKDIKNQKEFNELPDNVKEWIKKEQEKRQLTEPEAFELIVNCAGRSLRALQKEMLVKHGLTQNDGLEVVIAFYCKILKLVREEYDDIRENIHDRNYFHKYIVDNSMDDKEVKK